MDSLYCSISINRFETGFKQPTRRGLQTGLDNDLKSSLARLHKASLRLRYIVPGEHVDSLYYSISVNRFETGFKQPPRRGLQTGLDNDLKSGLARLHKASLRLRYIVPGEYLSLYKTLGHKALEIFTSVFT